MGPLHPAYNCSARKLSPVLQVVPERGADIPVCPQKRQTVVALQVKAGCALIIVHLQSIPYY